MEQAISALGTTTAIFHAKEVQLITAFRPDIEERYREMAAEYAFRCKTRPFIRRSEIALVIGARHFAVDIPRLQAYDRHAELNEVRQQLMAFSRVVSYAPGIVPNPWKQIGKCFHRKHSTVIYAERKYRDAIEKALG